MGRGINAILYLGAILGGLIGTFFLIDALLSRGSAPQQAAEATMAIGAVVVPYIMARAWSGIRDLNAEAQPRPRVGNHKT